MEAALLDRASRRHRGRGRGGAVGDRSPRAAACPRDPRLHRSRRQTASARGHRDTIARPWRCPRGSVPAPLGGCVKAMVWGCRGSLATPGPDTIATAATPPASRSVSPTIRCWCSTLELASVRSGSRLSAATSGTAHLAHASASRPHRRPRLLRAALDPRAGASPVGPTLTGRIARAEDRPLPFTTPLPRHARRNAGANPLPRLSGG